MSYGELALSFLLLIGFTLIVEGFHLHIPKGYIYFAMGFSVLVEVLNLQLRQRASQPFNLRDAYVRVASVPEMLAVTQPAPVRNISARTLIKKK